MIVSEREKTCDESCCSFGNIFGFFSSINDLWFVVSMVVVCIVSCLCLCNLPKPSFLVGGY